MLKSLNIRSAVGGFALGVLVCLASLQWKRTIIAVAAVGQLSIVEDDDQFIVLSYPQQTPFNEIRESRVRLPKYNYPAYRAYCSFWDTQAKPQGPPLSDYLWVESLSDY